MAHTDKDLPRWVAAQRDPNSPIWHTPGCPLRPDRRPAYRSVVVAVEEERTADWRTSPLTGESYAKIITTLVEVREWVAFTRPCDAGSRGGRCRRNVRGRRGQRRAPFDAQRSRDRDVLRGALRDYNTHGDTVVDPVPPCARYDWE